MVFDFFIIFRKNRIAVLAEIESRRLTTCEASESAEALLLETARAVEYVYIIFEHQFVIFSNAVFCMVLNTIFARPRRFPSQYSNLLNIYKNRAAFNEETKCRARLDEALNQLPGTPGVKATATPSSDG